MALKYETIVQDREFVASVGARTSAPGGGSLSSTQVGIHSLGVGQAATTQARSSASIAANATEETVVTVSGAALGDFCLVSYSIDVTGLFLRADVTAANTVTVNITNNTGGNITLGDGDLKVLVLKSA